MDLQTSLATPSQSNSLPTLNNTPLQGKSLATILLLCYNHIMPDQQPYFKAFALCLTLSLLMNTPLPADQVILIHGLARSAKTMEPMAKALQKAGHKTMILDYPSRHKTIRALVDDHLAPAVLACQKDGAQTIHFVTHSMGGILVRDYLSRHKLPELGRVVMLAPPNQGSEVVDRLGDWRAFKAINGPAGEHLGTAKTSAPKALGPVTYPVGIIAGDRSINPINSRMIEGADDGKVSIENTKVEGMTDHIVIHSTHPMMMKGKDAIALTLRFLHKGTFAPAVIPNNGENP